VRVPATTPSGFRNVDGGRIEDGRYAAFMADLAAFVPQERIVTDSVRLFAYGTDASFYRLNPRVVVKISSEAEARRILPLALKHGTPVTFRAAGTSLSGQAVTDSVMLKLSHGGKAFRNYEIKARACCLAPWLSWLVAPLRG
jgi:D-lactate dehydrogenase